MEDAVEGDAARPIGSQTMERFMSKVIKLRSSVLKISAAIAVIMPGLLFGPALEAQAQGRLGRPPADRMLEGTPVLPAGTQVIPEGTPLVIEMQTRLDSGIARISDRFTAYVATPVVDSAGRTILQPGTRIEGHVTNVKSAKWRHRSGELGLSFDYILMGDGRQIPLQGALVGTNRKMDEEGNFKASSSLRRDIIITTGGAGAGAGIGAIAGGGALAGAGIGAAAGLTVALLMKGKDVVLHQGDRFNLQLLTPLSLGPSPTSAERRAPTPLTPRPRTGEPSGSLSPGLDPNLIRTVIMKVPVVDIQAERRGDGYIWIQVRGELPTAGWRIYTHYDLSRSDTLNIRLRGVPPSGQGIRQPTQITAPTIIVYDRNGQIRNLVVDGATEDRRLTISSGPGLTQLQPSQGGGGFGTGSGSGGISQPFQQPTTQPTRPRLPLGAPADGSSISIPITGGSTGGSVGGSSGAGSTQSALATQVANQIDVLKMNYAAVIGLWVKNDGTVDEIGGRRVTVTERQLYDSLNFMLTSARTLRNPSIGPSERQRAARQLQADTQTAQGYWSRVRSNGLIGQDLERQWQNLQGSLRSLIDSSLR